MRKYPISLSQCGTCGGWICNVLCPNCDTVFHAPNVAAVWMEELEIGDEDESVVEGTELECFNCGWTGAVDEFKRESLGVRFFEIDDNEL
jgi:hypothetical protein